MSASFEEERRLRLEAQAEVHRLRQQLLQSSLPLPGSVPGGTVSPRGDQNQGPASPTVEAAIHAHAGVHTRVHTSGTAESPLCCESPVTGLVDHSAEIRTEGGQLALASDGIVSPVRRLQLPMQATPAGKEGAPASPAIVPQVAAAPAAAAAFFAPLGPDPLPPWRKATPASLTPPSEATAGSSTLPSALASGGCGPNLQSRSWVRSSQPRRTLAAPAPSPPLPVTQPRSSSAKAGSGGGAVFVIGGSSSATPKAPSGVQRQLLGGPSNGGRPPVAENDDNQPITGESILSCLKAAGTGGMTGAALAERFAFQRGAGGAPLLAKSKLVLQEGRARTLVACLKTLISDMDIYRRGGSSSVSDIIDLNDTVTVFVML